MQHWIDKFANAFRGIVYGVHGQTSFLVHGVAVVGVCATAAWLRCNYVQWSLLVLCIGLVLSLEMVNSAIESLAKGLCRDHNPEVGRALDIASAAVLLAAVTAAIVGLLVLGVQWFGR